MKIWAHRGCSQNYPENTMTAFKKACAIPGLAGIETDIQISKDGHLMVFHDERVERTTDGTGFLRDYTYEELRHLRMERTSGFRVSKNYWTCFRIKCMRMPHSS